MSKAYNNLPNYLKQYIVKQDYSLYTSIDQAVWRFIMLISVPFFKKHAHPVYIEGLDKTGVTLDKIPKLEEMDEKLDEFGWGAIAVKGFIPPAAFMDFLANRVLPICVDMRTAEHLMYTPAPDIIHESAGHAPIIANPDYANYLCNYGEIARKAIASKEDMDLYEIIRYMSDLKENPNASKEEITKIENEFLKKSKSIEWVSEAAELARMNWWTAEYGLIGKMKDPKIYGAGLLSSVIESYLCLSDKVKKINYTIDSTNYSYDITEPQPQLFVTKDFPKLSSVLNDFSNSMAYKTGGISGLYKAQTANSITTSVYDSGLQISGILKDLINNSNDELSYLQFSGPVQLSIDDNEIPSHGNKYHSQGFGAAIGNIEGLDKSLFQLSSSELNNLGIIHNNYVCINFSTGLKVIGTISNIYFIENRPLLIKLQDCSVTLEEKTLFLPEWGEYDLSCGEKIVSVFGGPADWDNYYSGQSVNTSAVHQSSNLTEQNRELNEKFKNIYNLRDKNFDKPIILNILEEINQKYPEDWLILIEILQLIKDDKKLIEVSNDVLKKLKYFSNSNIPENMIIQRALDTIMQ